MKDLNENQFYDGEGVHLHNDKKINDCKNYTVSKLSYDQIERYKRQLVLNEIGSDGQLQLLKSKVLIVGLGGLGSPVSMYLAAAGIGTIGIVDIDTVEMSNLHRQIVHSEERIGILKTKSCASVLRKLNSSVKIIEYNSLDPINQYDIVVDCTDNIDTRYRLSDYSRKFKKTYIAASVLRWSGQIFVLLNNGPCYRCLFPEKRINAATCNEAGVTGPLCGTIGSLQALEVIKVILGKSKESKLIVFDSLETNMNVFPMKLRNSQCSACQGTIDLESKVIAGKCGIQEQIPNRCENNNNGINNPQNMIELDDINDLKNDSVEIIEWNEYLNNMDKYLLIDIRSKALYDLIHIKGSVNLPMSQFDKELEKLKSSEKICIFLCIKGITAKKAAKKAIKEGIKCLVIRDGLKGYKEAIDSEFPL